MVVITQVFRVLRWGYRKLGASGPRKPGKIRGGKQAFPCGLFPGFPRMQSIRVGVQRTPGQKHNSTNSNFRVPSHSSGNQFVFAVQAESAAGVQRTKSFGAGFRGRRGPCLVLIGNLQTCNKRSAADGLIARTAAHDPIYAIGDRQMPLRLGDALPLGGILHQIPGGGQSVAELVAALPVLFFPGLGAFVGHLLDFGGQAAVVLLHQQA